jgi:hypothetical protein
MNTLLENHPNLPDFVHVFHIEDHEYYKPRLLELIERMKEVNNIQLNKEGYYYDYNIENSRTYKPLFESLAYPYAVELGEKYGLKLDRSRLPKLWFQQYYKHSSHGWHQHNGHWALVYYLELPEMLEATEFLNYGHNFKLKEGDMIFFPTFLIHRAPIITGEKRKTIIATNISFTTDREMIDRHGKQYFRDR